MIKSKALKYKIVYLLIIKVLIKCNQNKVKVYIIIVNLIIYRIKL